MPVKIQSPEAVAVKERFVETYYILYSKKVIKSKKEFCTVVGLSSPSNFKRMADSKTNGPSIQQLCVLIEKYGISPEWIMTGKGVVFSREKAIIEKA